MSFLVPGRNWQGSSFPSLWVTDIRCNPLNVPLGPWMPEVGMSGDIKHVRLAHSNCPLIMRLLKCNCRGSDLSSCVRYENAMLSQRGWNEPHLHVRAAPSRTGCRGEALRPRKPYSQANCTKREGHGVWRRQMRLAAAEWKRSKVQWFVALWWRAYIPDEIQFWFGRNCQNDRF